MSAIFERLLQEVNETLVGNETLTNVTFINSTAPSDVPSIVSAIPSSVPTLSQVPSLTPSETPSFFPTAMPSESPSLLPTTEEMGLVGGHQDQILRTALEIYGIIFVIAMLLFCWLRKKFPLAYNIRNWVESENLKTPLAANQHGFINWMWKLSEIEDMVMLDECGMDALCFMRVLEFGFKVASVGVLNSIWLMLVYRTSPITPENEFIESALVSMSTANVPPGNPRMFATVVGAYFIYGYSMYSILKEFEWFSKFRHTFLSKRLARNYAVYVENIPVEYQTSDALREFFSHAYPGTVIDAHLAIQAPNLKKKVAARESLILNLEHNINIRDITGVVPQAKNMITRQSTGSAIQAQAEELVEMNKVISESIDKLVENANNVEVMSVDDFVVGDFDESLRSSNDPNSPKAKGFAGLAGKSLKAATKGAMDVTKGGLSVVKDASGAAINVAGTGANLALSLVMQEDGENLSAGFVVFNSLRAVHGALQMIQYHQPYVMEVREAPQPEDVFWTNVGKAHKEIQIGKLISYAATTALCIFWTAIMGFIATLSSIDGLKEFEFVADMLEAAPWLTTFFEQIAPLMVVAAQELLKVILEIFSMQEGPISGAVVEASLFTKLAIFTIIQTFLIQALSGSVVSEIENMINNPTVIPNLLAQGLAGRGIFFMQLIVVNCVIKLSVECIRVSAVAQAIIRSKFGWNLTEAESNRSFMGIRPLADPLRFYHAQNLSGCVLYFLVFFVYATIAPIASFFVGICFFFMNACYRHQFVHIYPTFPDSGGVLWANFMKIVPTCMTIGQVVLQGLIALKQENTANVLMTPLTVMTILFQIYIRKQHFRITQFLPARDAIKADQQYASDNDYGFVEGEYVQPELREREKFPEIGNEEDKRLWSGKDEENMDVVVEDEGQDDTLKKAN